MGSPRGLVGAQRRPHTPVAIRDNYVSNRVGHVSYRRPNAHATISGNSSRHIASPCDPTRSLITTSAPASRSAAAHRVAFSRKNGSTCRRRGMCAGSDSASHRAAGSPRPARREDRAVDVRMPKPDGERELSTRRDTEHRSALGGQCDAEPRPHPSTDVLDEEPLVGGEPFRSRRPVSTPGAAASRRRSRWTPTIIVDGTSAASRTRPTARSADRHRRRRPPRADPAGRTP